MMSWHNRGDTAARYRWSLVAVAIGAALSVMVTEGILIILASPYIGRVFHKLSAHQLVDTGNYLTAMGTMLAAVAALWTLVAVLATAVLGLQQLQEGYKARNLTAILDRIKEIGTTKAIDARRRLYESFASDERPFTEQPFSSLPKNGLRDDAELIIAHLGELGILIDHGLLSPSFVSDRLGVAPIKLWVILEQYLKERGAAHGDGPPIAFMRAVKASLDSWLPARKKQQKAAKKPHRGKAQTVTAADNYGIVIKDNVSGKSKGWTVEQLIQIHNTLSDTLRKHDRERREIR
jgi:hypothetical protein